MSGIMYAENWLADLPVEIREAIVARMEIMELEAGAVIKSAGDAPDALFSIETGYVRLRGLDVDGGQTLLAIYKPGNNFGETPMIAKRVFAHTTTAMTNVRLMRLPEADFWQLSSKYPNIPTALMRKFEANTSRALSYQDLRHTRRLRSFIASTLVNLAEECGERLEDGSVRISIPITQSDIAEHVRATRQAVQREIGEIKQTGLLTKLNGRWHITSLEKLRTF